MSSKRLDLSSNKNNNEINGNSRGFPQNPQNPKDIIQSGVNYLISTLVRELFESSSKNTVGNVLGRDSSKDSKSRQEPLMVVQLCLCPDHRGVKAIYSQYFEKNEENEKKEERSILNCAYRGVSSTCEDLVLLLATMDLSTKSRDEDEIYKRVTRECISLIRKSIKSISSNDDATSKVVEIPGENGYLSLIIKREFILAVYATNHEDIYIYFIPKYIINKDNEVELLSRLMEKIATIYVYEGRVHTIKHNKRGWAEVGVYLSYLPALALRSAAKNLLEEVKKETKEINTVTPCAIKIKSSKESISSLYSSLKVSGYIPFSIFYKRCIKGTKKIPNKCN